MGRHAAKSSGRRSIGRRLDTPEPGTRRRSGGVVESAPRMRIHHERRKKAVRRTAIIAVIVLLAVVGGGAAWAYSLLHSAETTMNESPEIDARLTEVLTERTPSEPFTVLLLGDDRRKGETRARADTIIVARIDPEQKKVWLISIPRDTRVHIPGYGTDKINAANFYGGPALTVETVQEFLGIPINHYMGVNFTGFVKVVDAVGGVWIDVDVEIDDWKASSHSPGHRASHIAPGYQLLTGEYALTYVRSRDFPDADFTRMRHQQLFFKALADQAVQFKNVFKIPMLVKEIARYMSTDMSIGDIIDVATALRDMGGDNLQTATVAGEWRSPYVWTDEERMQFLVDAMMAGRSFDDTATVSTTGEIDPTTVSVTVRNGAGIEGCATTAANILKGLGYAVGEVGNANQFVYDNTLVVYKDQREAAVQIATALPKASVVEGRGMYQFTSDVLVVVGKDYATWGVNATP